MNPITDIIFSITWFLLLIWAIRSMARGWNLMTQPIIKNDVHPEMVDVKDGEELMGVTFKSCDIDEYNELQERISQLQNKLEDPWDDDDDDGDVPALIKR